MQHLGQTPSVGAFKEAKKLRGRNTDNKSSAYHWFNVATGKAQGDSLDALAILQDMASNPVETTAQALYAQIASQVASQDPQPGSATSPATGAAPYAQASLMAGLPSWALPVVLAVVALTVLRKKKRR